MAAEAGPAPVFEAALLTSAREALTQQRFIDSFRYAFLLIEFLFGDGKFKGDGLKAVLKKNTTLVSIVREVLADGMSPFDTGPSDTATLLVTNPGVDEVIDHLVDQRGFYFHGNIKRKDTWKPNQQAKAKLLAFLAIHIATGVGRAAAAPMFDERFNQRHAEYAKASGATIVLQVRAVFIEPDNGLSREANFNFSCPGTRLSPALVQGVAKEFFAVFEQHHPVEALTTVMCVRQDTGEKAFEMTFYPAAR
jgi:hypothetical protein